MAFDSIETRQARATEIAALANARIAAADRLKANPIPFRAPVGRHGFDEPGHAVKVRRNPDKAGWHAAFLDERGNMYDLMGHQDFGKLIDALRIEGVRFEEAEVIS